MADKEERIYITEVKEGDVCPFEENCEVFCEGCNVLPTRKEAINRMAKAAKKAYRGYFYTEPHHPNISDIMEAALNALLEDNK